jgi:hypothetical protein
VPEPVADCEVLALSVPLIDGVTVALVVAHADGVDVPFDEPLCDVVGVPVRQSVGEPDMDSDAVPQADAESVGEGVVVTESEDERIMPLDKYQQMKQELAPFLDGLQTQHTNPTQKSNGKKDLKHPSITYEVLVISGAGQFLDDLTTYHALSNTTDTMQIQNMVRARGLDEMAKIHWESIPIEKPELAPIFDMGKYLKTTDPTSTQIFLLRGLMAQLWRMV